MKNYLVAERYAKALRSTLDDDALDAALETLTVVTDMYVNSESLRNFLSNPAIDLYKRQEGLRNILKQLEIEECILRLVQTLLARGRMALLSDVSTVFGMLVDDKLNRVQVTVVTAVETGPEQHERLRKVLSGWSGKEVRMQRDIDPDILGGVIVRLGDAVIDGSVRTRIEHLREQVLAHDIRVESAS